VLSSALHFVSLSHNFVQGSLVSSPDGRIRFGCATSVLRRLLSSDIAVRHISEHQIRLKLEYCRQECLQYKVSKRNQKIVQRNEELICKA
jgi:hypothetical protein